MQFKGTLPLLILHLLENNVHYGYALQKMIFECSDESLEYRDSTIYGTLDRLEKRGFINGKETTIKGKRVIMYRVTPTGRTYLNQFYQYWEDFKAATDQVLNCTNLGGVDDESSESPPPI